MGFFKAYDMRGTYGVDFDLPTVYRIGRALPQVVGGTRWLVGRDARVSSDAVRRALIRGLRAAGVEVVDLGRVTTPMVYFFTAEENFDGSVMITASHNPPADNGLKVSRRGALPVGYADGLNQVEALVASDTTLVPDDLETREIEGVTFLSALPRYLAWQKARAFETGTLKLIVDCSNGMAGLFAAEMFPHATILNETIDGTFPAHAPNPLVADAREQLAAQVRAEGADVGVIFDGDADRAMFVDEKGRFVQPDYLIPIVARSLARKTSIPRGTTVIHDVRTSRGAIETLVADGFKPQMVPVGHAFAKPALRESGAFCGGELAGHYYFKSFFGCDSGLLAALAVLDEVARAKAAGLTFSQLMAPILSRYANSGERNFRVADKSAAIQRVLATAAQLGVETGRETMDGVRLEFADGWINVRPSNTEPYLRLIVEARTAAQLAARLAALTAAIEGKASL